MDGKQNHAWSGDQTFDGTKEIAKQATGTNRENQTINWKLTVGNGTTDIAGKIVTDEWTIPADVQQIMLSDEAEFTIKLYDSFDHETKTIKVKKGSADFAKYFTETSANGFEFKVPSDEGEVKRCTVEYQTKIEREVGNGNTITVTNTAPIFVAAQNVMYQAGTLVAQMATLLPGLTPIDTSARANVSTSSRNSS